MIEEDFNVAQQYINTAIRKALEEFMGNLQTDETKDILRSKVRLALTETIEEFIRLGELKDSYSIICSTSNNQANTHRLVAKVITSSYSAEYVLGPIIEVRVYD